MLDLCWGSVVNADPTLNQHWLSHVLLGWVLWGQVLHGRGVMIKLLTVKTRFSSLG